MPRLTRASRKFACIPDPATYYRNMRLRPRAIGRHACGPGRPRGGLVTIVAVGLLFGLGCRAPVVPEGPTAITLRVPDYETFVDAACSVLRRYDFPPEHVDPGHGVIVTAPATSGQWFEPWRVDSQGPYQLFESSLHTLRRTVTVRLKPVGATEPASQPTVADVLKPEWEQEPSAWGAARYRVSVQVDKSRYSAPERQITTTSGALAMYSIRIPTTAGVRGAPSREVAWVPLGRDPLLEAFLLEKIADALPEVAVAE